MESLKKFFSSRLVKAIATDGIDYLSSIVPIPKQTLKTLFELKNIDACKFIEWDLKDWENIYSKEKDSFVLLPHKGKVCSLPQVLYLNNIEKKLTLSSIIFQLDSEPFNIPNHIRDLTEKAFERLDKKLNTVNNENLRLVDIFEKDTNLYFKVQPVEYEAFIHTNLVMDAKIDTTETLRQYLHNDGKLEPFDKSPLANHIGINILLFTANGSLILPKRSKQVAFRRGELSPSASGAVSYGDIINNCRLEEMHKLREAFEELGLKSTDIKNHNIIFLGLTRELIRGGKPELFFFARTELSENDIKKKWEKAQDKWENQDLSFHKFGKIAYEILDTDDKKNAFLLEIDKFIDEYTNDSSLPLLTNLALWIEYRLSEG